MVMHPLQEITGDRIARRRADYGINSALKTNRRSHFVRIFLPLQPPLDRNGLEDSEAIKASTPVACLEFPPMVTAVFMCGSNV
jgi:hypothetical protein